MTTPITSTFPLLASKLYPGVGTLHPLARPRLDPPPSLLDGGLTVASIVAPAGYGKSTLMARWYTLLDEAEVRGAWISLDEDDNEPTRFMRYLVAALQNVEAGMGRDVLSQLAAESLVVPQVLLESIASDLARLQRRAVLFLDDLHFINNADVLRIIEWMVNYAQPHIQFVLGSREALRIRLSGLRMRGSLLEIDHRRLAFDNEEAMRFYQARLQAQPDEYELRQLVHKTEGWPAGLELLALALREEPHQADLIEDFTGTDRSVVEYLGDVVLATLEQQVRTFLYQIAQFDRICGKLAQAATGQADAQAQLAALYERNLFLIALDREGTWFRFHHLVGDFFRRRPPVGGTVDRTAVLLDGAQWLFEQGHVEDAINCAVHAEAWEQACSWLAETVEETSHRLGEHHVVLRWMHEIPQQWIDRFPAIGIHYAFSLVFSPQQAEAERQLARLERSLRMLANDPSADVQHTATLRCAVDLQQILLLALRDEGAMIQVMAQAWLQCWQYPGSPASLLQLGSAENALAYGCKSCGDIDAGLAAIERARGHLLRDAGHYGLAWNAMLTAILQMKRGDYQAAHRASTQGLSLVRDRLGSHGGHAAFFHVILAAIAYEFGDIDTAVKEIEAGLVNIDVSGISDILILAHLTQARLQFLRVDRRAGFATLRQGREVARTRGFLRLEVTLAAEECTWLCRTGDVAQAEELAHRLGFRYPVAVGPDWDLQRDKSSRVGSRLMLRSAPTHVAAILDSALAHCRDKRRYHRAVELLVLQIAAWHYADATDKASAALAEALQLCQTHGHRRVMLDDIDMLRDIIPQMIRQPAFSIGLQLPDWLKDALAPAASAQARSLPEMLTKRELRILGKLESSLSNREIAESLFISEGTLKWHLNNIYGKLNARNRSGALNSARALGLL